MPKKSRRRKPVKPVKDPVYTSDQEYQYHFELSSFKGVCLTTGQKIFVITKCPPKQFENVFLISHINYLKCMYTNSVDSHLICENVGPSVSDYFNSLDKITAFNLPLPPGNQHISSHQLHYLHPKVRQVILQMFRFVFDLDKKDFSLNPFELKDLRMDGTCLEFCGIGFKSKPSTEDRRENYQSVKKAIKELLGTAYINVPSLVNLFEYVDGLTFRYTMEQQLILSHLAIQSPAIVGQFLKKCKEVIPKSLTAKLTVYEQVMDRVTNCRGWDSRFKDDDRYMAVRFCYQHEESRYKQTGNTNSVKASLLTFVRNVLVHLNEYLDRNDPLKDEEVEAVIMCLYSTPILETQIGLYEEGLLDEYMTTR